MEQAFQTVQILASANLVAHALANMNMYFMNAPWRVMLNVTVMLDFIGMKPPMTAFLVALAQIAPVTMKLFQNVRKRKAKTVNIQSRHHLFTAQWGTVKLGLL